jgi:hypothetical protein
MPAINTVNDAAVARSIKADYILVGDVGTIPCAVDSEKCVNSQVWMRDETGYVFTGLQLNIAERFLDNYADPKSQDYLSVKCASRTGKSVGVLRLEL